MSYCFPRLARLPRGHTMAGDSPREWRLHNQRPGEVDPAVRSGDCVAVKKLGATGTVAALHGETAAVTVPDPRCPAVPKALEVHASQLTRVYADGVVACPETDVFRLLAATQLRQDDVCVELGSCYGHTTAVLAKHCALVVGVDTSQSAVAAAREAYPQLEFRQFDVIEEPYLLADVADACTVCFVDIGGNRELEALCRLLPLVEALLRPRLVCVKSRALYAAAEAHAQRHGGAARGRVPQAHAWWSAMLADERLQAPAKPAKQYHNDGQVDGASRFTQFPLAYLPVDAPDGSGRQICRFHNYGVCKRSEGECHYDHAHCHHCLGRGHRAKNCSARSPLEVRPATRDWADCRPSAPASAADDARMPEAGGPAQSRAAVS